MKVSLSYFKASGKYYSSGEYETNKEDLWEIWNEVEDMLLAGKRPGLADGYGFNTLVLVPDHPDYQPHMIMESLIK
jgi:hypothetical protein